MRPVPNNIHILNFIRQSLEDKTGTQIDTKTGRYSFYDEVPNFTHKKYVRIKYDLYFLRGIAKYSRGVNNFGFNGWGKRLLKSAKRDFTNCIRINKNFYAFVNRGETNFQLRNIEEALKDFNRALKISFLFKGEINSSDISKPLSLRSFLFPNILINLAVPIGKSSHEFFPFNNSLIRFNWCKCFTFFSNFVNHFLS